MNKQDMLLSLIVHVLFKFIQNHVCESIRHYTARIYPCEQLNNFMSHKRLVRLVNVNCERTYT